MFTDFATYTNNEDLVISVSFGAPSLQADGAYVGNIPMIGTGSLQFDMRANNCKGNIVPSSSMLRGLRTGNIQTLVMPYNTNGTGIWAFGIYCMGNSSADLSSSTGGNNCYVLQFSNQNASNTISLRKSTSGVVLNPTVLATASTTWTYNTIIPVLLSWKVSGTGVELVARIGTYSAGVYPFSALTTVISYTDTSGAYISTFGEGFYGLTTTAANARVFWDKSRWAGTA